MVWREYCLFPEELLEGNRVTLLIDGEAAYPAMLEAIAGAKQQILLDSYMFNNDRVGSLFRDVLCEKARSGLDVRIIVDSMGIVNVPSGFFEDMRSEGVQVLEYHPVVPWRRGFNLLRRNHRKLLVVDRECGFAGGINIGDEWLPQKEGGLGWHDIHLRIEGPAVRELARLSLATWSWHGTASIEEKTPPEPHPLVGTSRAAVVGSRERKRRKAILHSYQHAIKRARSYIYIANAYFLPDLGFRRALANAAKRGVDVRVMVSKTGDLYSIQMASQAIFGSLLRNRIRVFLWKDAVLHAKTAVIDDIWSTVGSYNLDRRSWAMNLEVNVNLADQAFARELRDVFINDVQRCEELTQKSWQSRPLLQRVIEKFFFLFRKFM